MVGAFALESSAEAAAARWSEAVQGRRAGARRPCRPGNAPAPPTERRPATTRLRRLERRRATSARRAGQRRRRLARRPIRQELPSSSNSAVGRGRTARHHRYSETLRVCRLARSFDVPLSRKWRNWQTHQLEGLALARAWGFESPLPHQDIKRPEKSGLSLFCSQTGHGLVTHSKTSMTLDIHGHATERKAPTTIRRVLFG